VTEAALPPDAWPAWTGSNHDMFRFPTRWAGNDQNKARAALLMLLCLRGTPVLYQGDEIGQLNATLVQEDLRDPLGVRFWPYYAGRDAGRTPMQWRDTPGGGFTAPGVRPWLPLSDLALHNVESQRSDPDSMLTLARDLIALRRRTPDLHGGDYETLDAPDAPDAVWAWRRGERAAVVVNMSDQETTLAGWQGTIALGTDRRRDGEAITGTLRLGAWEAVVTERA
jgi:alpha-glucosidase